PVERRRGDLPNDDDPEHSVVLQPCGALDERTQIQAVDAGSRRRLDRELEPRHLPRADVGGRLDRDTVVPWPSRIRGAELAVASKRAGSVLTRLGAPRAQIRDLAHATADPSL